MQVAIFRDALTKAGKERGETLLQTQVDEIVLDCKLDHEGEIIVEDFAKYLLSK